MNASHIDKVIARSGYHGTTKTALADRSIMDTAKAVVNHRVLFPRRGTATVLAHALELSDWDDGPLIVHPGDIDDIDAEFSKEYGRFIGGGVKKWGAPISLRLHGGDTICLLINHRWFSERTDNAEWLRLLRQWRRQATAGER